MKTHNDNVNEDETRKEEYEEDEEDRGSKASSASSVKKLLTSTEKTKKRIALVRRAKRHTNIQERQEDSSPVVDRWLARGGFRLRPLFLRPVLIFHPHCALALRGHIANTLR